MPDPIIPAATAEASPSTPETQAPSTPAVADSSRNEKGQFQAASGPAKPTSEPTIYEKVRKNLEKFREAGEKEENETSAAEEVVEDETPDPAVETDTDQEPSEPEKPATEAAADVTPAPTLPAAHVRSLKAFGLTDAEIEKTSPEVAAALHSRRNQEITRWAEAGRQQQARTQQPPAPVAPLPPAAPPGTATTAPAIDMAAVEKTYGAEEPLVVLLKTQQQELAESKAFRQRYEQDVQQRQLQAQQQQLQTLGKQIDAFFSSADLKPFHDVYGTTAATLTDEQAAKRQEVLKLTDAIVGGARQSGVDLGLDQALQHAFDSLSAPLQKQAARKEVVAAVQKRSKGITLKPGGRPTPKSPTPQRAGLEKSVRTKLKEVFG